MTSTEMKARVDTILDEVTGASTFWTSTEVYAGLTDGQNKIIGILLAVYRAKRNIDPNTKLFYELEALLNDNSGSAQTADVPTGFLELISATFDHDGTGGEKPCFIKDLKDIAFEENNTFLAATGPNPKVYLKSVADVIKIVFLPTASGTPAFTYHFIKAPADIAAGQNALLPISTHNAIVEFAVARLLAKDQRVEESQQHSNFFIEEVKMMLGV